MDSDRMTREAASLIRKTHMEIHQQTPLCTHAAGSNAGVWRSEHGGSSTLAVKHAGNTAVPPKPHTRSSSDSAIPLSCAFKETARHVHSHPRQTGPRALQQGNQSHRDARQQGRKQHAAVDLCGHRGWQGKVVHGRTGSACGRAQDSSMLTHLRTQTL